MRCVGPSMFWVGAFGLPLQLYKTPRELILDVGFNIGQDTAMYLEADYFVLAIEADPRLVRWASRTQPFRRAIREGRLVLLNNAVAMIDALNASFYINMCANELSTRVRASCESSCHRCVEVNVLSISCKQLLQTYPGALYMKIDIEGADHECVRSLLEHIRAGGAPPKYISTESGWDGGIIKDLMHHGYRKFKFTERDESGNHSTGTGAFGEFAFDKYSKYAWRTYEEVWLGPRSGDLHFKFDPNIEHSSADHILSAWQRSPSWPFGE